MKIIVLGGGVLGVSTAWYLAKAGCEVIVIERQPKVALETSFGNAGQISPGYAAPWAAPGLPRKALKWLFQRHAPLVIRPDGTLYQWQWLMNMLNNCNEASYAINKNRMLCLAEYSRAQLSQLRTETGLCYEARQRGTLQLFRSQAQIDEMLKDTRVLEECGVPFNVLDREGCVAIEPALARVKHKILGGLQLPNDETGDCQLFTAQLAERMVEDYRVQFRFGCCVDAIEYQGNTVTAVRAAGETLTADHYVVALGSYSRGLLKTLALTIPVYPVKGYSLTLPITHAARAPLSTVIDETYKVAITRFDNRIRVGGMAELSGYNLEINPRRRATLEKVLNELYPDAGNMAAATCWAGLRPMTPDGTPIIGATRFNNLSLNTGHGTLGWTMSAGSGKLLADLIIGVTPQIPTEGLSIQRYERPRQAPAPRRNAATMGV